MGFADDYFRKQRSFQPFIKGAIQQDLAYIIVIPATKERDLMKAIRSLYLCEPVKHSTEVIVLLNASAESSEDVKKLNAESFLEIQKFDTFYGSPKKRFFPILVNELPPRHAGVGLARKLGMDEALWRFNLLNKPDGLIVCFDADAVCETNFLPEIEKLQLANPAVKAGSIYFEHDISDPSCSASQVKGIISYEIHLRYYKLALEFVGFPYSYHTVGSSMFVNANTYAREGGMNKNKAGEDFYFLQKIIPLGDFYELNTTRILLSPRESDRVPFGTGAAMTKLIHAGSSSYQTYKLEAILSLQPLFAITDKFYKAERLTIQQLQQQFPETLTEFHFQNDFTAAVVEMNRNAASLNNFRKRFFQWWNAFRILKYLNHAHSRTYAKIDASVAAEEFLKIKIQGYQPTGQPEQILKVLRELDRIPEA